jgi:DtxR family Mn-dependent transcriptional regulator
MALSDRAEEILEHLYGELVEHGKERCDASILRDDEVLRELTEQNYVTIQDDGIALLEKGVKEGKSCMRRHRLAERLFVDVLDCKKKMLHETSCRFEHLLHEALDESICTLLGHPRTCPHGKPIPEGRCCREAKKVPEKIIMPLTELAVNRSAKIAYLQTQDRDTLQKIIAMGALPTTEITLLQKFPSYVFKIGKSQFAIDEELASHIRVRIV